MLQKDGIQLVLDIDDNLPSICGNANQLSQVFQNLIANARHALNEKFPQENENKYLEIALRTVTKQEYACVQMRVRDQGTGISQHHQKRIFTPFFTTKPSHQGTGLGLSIVNDIIAKHNGAIEVESESGEFTEFRIELPIMPPQ